MKRVIIILMLVLIMLSTACGQTKMNETEEVKESPLVQKTPLETASPMPEIEILPNPIPSQYEPIVTDSPIILFEPIVPQPGTPIPDIIVSDLDNRYHENFFHGYISNYYEHEGKRYYFDKYSRNKLRVIDLGKKEIVKVIANVDDYVINNGYLFVLEDKDENNMRSIVRYDIKDWIKKTIVRNEYYIEDIYSAQDKLYFLYEDDNCREAFCLYMCDFNGESAKIIGEDLQRVILYNDRIFGISMGEVGQLVECYPDKEQIYLPHGDLITRIYTSLGNIICVQDMRNAPSVFLVYNTETAETRQIRLFDNIEMVGRLTVAGQYFIRCERDEVNNTAILYAYDYLNNIDYYMMDISLIVSDVEFFSMSKYRDEIYIKVSSDDKSIYRLTIEDGKANIELWMEFEFEDNEAPSIKVH